METCNLKQCSSKSFENVDKQSSTFIFKQLLFESLYHISTNVEKSGIDDMICACRANKNYVNNLEQQKLIDEFLSSYKPMDAIKWYIKPGCFLQESMNEALRSQDIDQIFKFRRIITDIYNQLSELKSEFCDPLEVYRGQLMKRFAVLMLKKCSGGLVSVNSFFSTSEDKHVAEMFSGLGAARPFLESVLFEIMIDTTIKAKPYANIKTEHIKYEKEVLMSIGTVFRIHSVNFDPKYYYHEIYVPMWIIKLSLIKVETEEIQRFINCIIDQEIKPSQIPLSILADYLADLGQFDKALKYHEIQLNELPSPLDLANKQQQQLDLSDIYDSMGSIYRAKKDYILALKYFTICIEQRKLISHNHPKLRETYLQVAFLCRENADYNGALEWYSKLLDMQEKALNPDELYIMETCMLMGPVLCVLNHFPESIKKLEQALQIAERENMSHEIARAYYHMGVVYDKQNDPVKAFINYKQGYKTIKGSVNGTIKGSFYEEFAKQCEKGLKATANKIHAYARIELCENLQFFVLFLRKRRLLG
ncbi:unnamed protein product [Didymodactylos carnosus]|uniref:Tetratricopeptide repeat protein n=1 Tax=Didymodactylos carnosus TaxID=1234261 RepID=A0A815V1P8_9BILA|nr:unnamed protein product [Didymodactylos carnosus]CAF4385363.1 unnamed protein product [Didymodactylos carnosus]